MALYLCWVLWLSFTVKGVVQHFVRFSYLLSCPELDATFICLVKYEATARRWLT